MQSDNSFLIHYGIKGQQWGVRRFQNEDGTLTPEGRERYGQLSDSNRKQYDTYKNMAAGIEATNEKLKAQYQMAPSNRLKSAIDRNNKDIADFNKLADDILSGSKQRNYSTAGTVLSALGMTVLGLGAIKGLSGGAVLRQLGAERSVRIANTAFTALKGSGALLLGKRFLAGIKGDKNSYDPDRKNRA